MKLKSILSIILFFTFKANAQYATNSDYTTNFPAVVFTLETNDTLRIGGQGVPLSPVRVGDLYIQQFPIQSLMKAVSEQTLATNSVILAGGSATATNAINSTYSQFTLNATNLLGLSTNALDKQATNSVNQIAQGIINTNLQIVTQVLTTNYVGITNAGTSDVNGTYQYKFGGLGAYTNNSGCFITNVGGTWFLQSPSGVSFYSTPNLLTNAWTFISGSTPSPNSYLGSFESWNGKVILGFVNSTNISAQIGLALGTNSTLFTNIATTVSQNTVATNLPFWVSAIQTNFFPLMRRANGFDLSGAADANANLGFGFAGFEPGGRMLYTNGANAYTVISNGYSQGGKGALFWDLTNNSGSAVYISRNTSSGGPPDGIWTNGSGTTGSAPYPFLTWYKELAYLTNPVVALFSSNSIMDIKQGTNRVFVTDYGSDATGRKGLAPYRTLGAAITNNLDTYGQAIEVGSGDFSLFSGMQMTNGQSIRGSGWGVTRITSITPGISNVIQDTSFGIIQTLGLLNGGVATSNILIRNVTIGNPPLTHDALFCFGPLDYNWTLDNCELVGDWDLVVGTFRNIRFYNCRFTLSPGDYRGASPGLHGTTVAAATNSYYFYGGEINMLNAYAPTNGATPSSACIWFDPNTTASNASVRIYGTKLNHFNTNGITDYAIFNTCNATNIKGWYWDNGILTYVLGTNYHIGFPPTNWPPADLFPDAPTTNVFPYPFLASGTISTNGSTSGQALISIGGLTTWGTITGFPSFAITNNQTTSASLNTNLIVLGTNYGRWLAGDGSGLTNLPPANTGGGFTSTNINITSAVLYSVPHGLIGIPKARAVLTAISADAGSAAAIGDEIDINNVWDSNLSNPAFSVTSTTTNVLVSAAEGLSGSEGSFTFVPKAGGSPSNPTSWANFKLKVYAFQNGTNVTSGSSFPTGLTNQTVPVPIIQAGKTNGSVLTTQVYTFKYPMPSTNYTPSVVGNGLAVPGLVYTAKTTTDFTTTMTAFTGNLDWSVIQQTQ